jgi:hypothetical protein
MLILLFKDAFLCLNGFDGYSETPVEVIGETPKRYRIICPPDRQAVKLAGRNRWLRVGETALVPKTAIKVKPGKGTQ